MISCAEPLHRKLQAFKFHTQGISSRPCYTLCDTRALHLLLFQTDSQAHHPDFLSPAPLSFIFQFTLALPPPRRYPHLPRASNDNQAQTVLRSF